MNEDFSSLPPAARKAITLRDLERFAPLFENLPRDPKLVRQEQELSR